MVVISRRSGRLCPRDYSRRRRDHLPGTRHRSSRASILRRPSEACALVWRDIHPTRAGPHACGRNHFGAQTSACGSDAVDGLKGAPQTRAQKASRVAQAESQAATTLNGLNVPQRYRQAVGRLITALRSESAAFRELANSAGADSRSGYPGAVKGVTAASLALADSARTLATYQLGTFRVGVLSLDSSLPVTKRPHPPARQPPPPVTSPTTTPITPPATTPTTTPTTVPVPAPPPPSTSPGPSSTTTTFPAS